MCRLLWNVQSGDFLLSVEFVVCFTNFLSGDGILSGMNTCGYATDFLLSFPCPEEHISISCVGPDGKPTLIDGSEVEGNTNCWKVEYLPQIEGLIKV